MKVLVVDDEPDVRVMLRHMLESEGWIVDDSPSGESALEHWQELGPDVIVTDNMMPGMIGMELASSLREQGFKGPLLLFSAYLDSSVIEQARAAGIVPISKVDHQSLLRMLRALEGDL